MIARLVISGLLAVAVLVGLLRVKPPHELTIESGPVGGSYHQDALAYQKFMAARGIDLKIQPKPNSLEIIKDVSNAQSGVDVGFIAQDTTSSQDAPVSTIGDVELQPLFVFASAELGRRSTLDDLRGRKVVMPPSDSATSDAAVRVFQLYDITKENTSFTFMPLTDAVRELRAGHFDAAAFMLAPESPVIRDLAADSGLHLVPIAEAKAIANHLPFLRPVVLPRGIYDIADAIPPVDTPMVAAPVGIVVRKNLHPWLIYSLLEALTKVHHGATLLSMAGDFPTITGSRLEADPQAIEYYRSGLPWAYRALPPWPAAFISTYPVAILAVLLLGVLCMTVVYLADASSALIRWGAAQRRSAKNARNSADASLSRTPPITSGR
jgi:TRAP-type uncharacterized transport system substrate-binding protein